MPHRRERLEGRKVQKVIWKWAPGWEGFYQVSNEGNVRSVNRVVIGRSFRGRILKVTVTTGYPVVTLSKPDKKQQVYVHDLVCAAFLGPKPEVLEVCHNDGNPFNPRLENLRYDTRSANSQDRFRHNTVARLRGIKHPSAKLSVEEAETIRMMSGIISNRGQARMYGVSHTTISGVVRNKTYK